MGWIVATAFTGMPRGRAHRTAAVLASVPTMRLGARGQLEQHRINSVDATLVGLFEDSTTSHAVPSEAGRHNADRFESASVD